MNNSPIYCASFYFPRASTTFKKTAPFREDTMKLMSRWCPASVQPSETILTHVEGHADLIGCRILSTFFAFTNNVVLVNVYAIIIVLCISIDKSIIRKRSLRNAHSQETQHLSWETL
jgi:hypothetical protein